MKLIKPSVELLWVSPDPLKNLEAAGRTCYKSEDKITDKSAGDFVCKMLTRGHEAMIEHATMSFRVICDRGVTHEIVRHRLFSFAQESTRYCNYACGVTFVIPPWFDLDETEIAGTTICDWNEPVDMWIDHMLDCEAKYQRLLSLKQTPQQARSVLPNSLKTEIVITGNMREWRHFFKLRCAKSAHPQMQEVANMMLADADYNVPVLFEGFKL